MDSYRVVQLENEIAQLKKEKAQLAYQFEDFRQNAALHWPEARSRDYRWPASVAPLDLSVSLFEKGRKLFKQNKWESALNEFQKIVDSFPQSRWITESYYYMCEVYFQVRDFKSSTACVAQMAELFPENSLTGFQLLRLAQVHEMHGQAAEALEIYRMVGQYFSEPILRRQARESVARLE